MLSRHLFESLREFDTAILANTLDYIDDTPTHEFYMGGDICSVTPGLSPTVGVAVTCQMDSSTPEGEPDMDPFWQQLEQMDSMDVPAVWVVETVGSRPDHECVLGDGTAKLLHSVGCVGSVTNGRVRDVEGLLTVPLAVYCRGTVVHHCALRIVAIDVPVSVGGIVVQPGDIIHAWEEGVIRVPPGSAEKLVELAPRHRAVEHQVHTFWRRTDVSLADKRRFAVETYKQNGFTRKD